MAELHPEHSDSKEHETSQRGLVREVRMPIPPAARRPCAVIGMCLAFVFIAATLDAYLWQYSMERETLREQTVTSEMQIIEFAAELQVLEEENSRLRMQLETQESVDSVLERYELERRLADIKRRALSSGLDNDVDPDLLSPF